MNIPVEHFTATPVYALSPHATHDNSNNDNQAGTTAANNGHQRTPVFKLGVPRLPGATNSAGSAPNSPDLARRRFSEDVRNSNLPPADLSLDNSFLNSAGAPQGNICCLKKKKHKNPGI